MPLVPPPSATPADLRADYEERYGSRLSAIRFHVPSLQEREAVIAMSSSNTGVSVQRQVTVPDRFTGSFSLWWV